MWPFTDRAIFVSMASCYLGSDDPKESCQCASIPIFRTRAQQVAVYPEVYHLHTATDEAESAKGHHCTSVKVPVGCGICGIGHPFVFACVGYHEGLLRVSVSQAPTYPRSYRILDDRTRPKSTNFLEPVADWKTLALTGSALASRPSIKHNHIR